MTADQGRVQVVQGYYISYVCSELVLIFSYSFYEPQLPVSQTTRSRCTSSSAASVDSSAVPDALRCQYYGCHATYRGKYRIGNLGRHLRIKHGANEQKREYPCEIEDCPKTYMRQDARLKHYRKEHPALAAPAESRR
jgi:hypothetical protein